MFIAYPVEYARTRMTNDLTLKGNKKEFGSIYQTINKAYKAGGISAIYRGFSMTFPTITIYRGLTYGGYDSIINKKDHDKITKFLLSYCIVASSTALIHPFNTLRVRAVMTVGEQKYYKSWTDAFSKIYKREGLRAFYRGILATFVKNIGTSLVLVIYDEVSQYVKGQGQN